MSDHISIREITGSNFWDSHVQKKNGSEFSHLFEWSRVIQEAYGHRPIYLAAIQNRDGIHTVCGILPLFYFRSMAGGKRFVSLPFLDTAGILADSRQVESMLLNKAMALMKETGCMAMDIRQNFSLGCSKKFKGFDLNISTIKVGLKLKLGLSQQRVKKNFKSKLRSQINRAVKNGLRSRIGKEELIKPFYKVFSRNMRDLGSPVHSQRFFEAVMENFHDQAFICVVFHGTQPVAAGFMFRFKDEIKNPWASSLREFRPLSPNMLLYWEMIRFSCNLGMAWFDMGRSSSNASTFRFKEQWQPRVRQIYWYQWSSAGSSFKNEKLHFPFLTRLPVGVANIVGPFARRHISL